MRRNVIIPPTRNGRDIMMSQARRKTPGVFRVFCVQYCDRLINELGRIKIARYFLQTVFILFALQSFVAAFASAQVLYTEYRGYPTLKTFLASMTEYQSKLRSSTDFEVNLELHLKWAQKANACLLTAVPATAATALAETLPIVRAIVDEEFLSVYEMSESGWREGRYVSAAPKECTQSGEALMRGLSGEVLGTALDAIQTSVDFLSGFELDDRAIAPHDGYLMPLQQTRNCAFFTTKIMWHYFFNNPKADCRKRDLFYQVALKEAARRNLRKENQAFDSEHGLISESEFKNSN
jgi:hypothetical protein